MQELGIKGLKKAYGRNQIVTTCILAEAAFKLLIVSKMEINWFGGRGDEAGVCIDDCNVLKRCRKYGV